MGEKESKHSAHQQGAKETRGTTEPCSRPTSRQQGRRMGPAHSGRAARAAEPEQADVRQDQPLREQGRTQVSKAGDGLGPGTGWGVQAG